MLLPLLCFESCRVFRGNKKEKENTIKSRRKVRKSFSLTYDSLTTPEAAPGEAGRPLAIT